jgi:hypothetical protein
MRGKPGDRTNSRAIAAINRRIEASAVRETSVTVRFSADEHRFASKLAEVDGISISDVVRMSIRRAYEARFGLQR